MGVVAVQGLVLNLPVCGTMTSNEWIVDEPAEDAAEEDCNKDVTIGLRIGDS